MRHAHRSARSRLDGEGSRHLRPRAFKDAILDLFAEVKAGERNIGDAVAALSQKPEKGGGDKERAKPKRQNSGRRAPGNPDPEIPASTVDYARWLFERADEKELPMLIAWIEAAHPGDVVQVLRDLQQKRAASAETPTAKQGNGAVPKARRPRNCPRKRRKTPPEAEAPAKSEG
jgi:hypothetical protein